MRTRVIGILLAVCMVLAVMPTVALASEPTRSTVDLAGSVSYSTAGGTATGNPVESSITDCTEGWTWCRAPPTCGSDERFH